MDTFLKRLITVLVSLFLLVYVGFQAYQILYTTIEVETVGSYKVYETIETKGVAIRNETVVSQGADGYLFYTTENGGPKTVPLPACFPAKTMRFRSSSSICWMRRSKPCAPSMPRARPTGRTSAGSTSS